MNRIVRLVADMDRSDVSDDQVVSWATEVRELLNDALIGAHDGRVAGLLQEMLDARLRERLGGGR